MDVHGLRMAIRERIRSDSRYQWCPVHVSCSSVVSLCRVSKEQRISSKEDTVGLLLETDSLPQFVWPAARSFASWVMLNEHLFLCKTVLELGSGTGVGGLAATALGHAKSVVLSDCSPVALALLDETVQRNLESRTNNLCASALLKWGNEEHIEQVLAEHGKFDVVLGCDIFYFQNSLRVGLGTAHVMLSDGGLFVCSSAVRSDRMDFDLDTIPLQSGFDVLSCSESEELRTFVWKKSTD